MPVISIRFDSIRFVSFRFISSQPLREGKREGGKRTALRLGKVLCLGLLALVVIEKVEFIIFFFISRYAAGFRGSSRMCCSIIALWLSYKLGR